MVFQLPVNTTAGQENCFTSLSCFFPAILSLSRSNKPVLQKQRRLSILHRHCPILTSSAGHQDLPDIPEQKINSPSGCLAPYQVSLVITGDLCKLSLESDTLVAGIEQFISGQAKTQCYQVRTGCQISTIKQLNETNFKEERTYKAHNSRLLWGRSRNLKQLVLSTVRSRD